MTEAFSKGLKIIVTGLLLSSLLILQSCEKAHSNKSELEETLSANQIESSRILVSGELFSKETAIINPPKLKNMWQYKVTFMLPEGASVSKGQPVVAFETSPIKQQLAVKQSELKSAQKKLENTKRVSTEKAQKLKLDFAEKQMKMEKAKRKADQQNVSVSQLKIQKLKYEYKIALDEFEKSKAEQQFHQKQSTVDANIGQSNIDQLVAEVNQLKASIERGSVKAPKSGVVVYKADYQGKKVSIGDTVWMGREILELPSLETIAVKAEVPEVETQKVAIGQRVEVTMDAFPEKSFNGQVVELGRVYKRKSNDQPVIVFEIKIDLDSPDTKIMRPGMKVRIAINSEKAA